MGHKDVMRMRHRDGIKDEAYKS